MEKACVNPKTTIRERVSTLLTATNPLMISLPKGLIIDWIKINEQVITNCCITDGIVIWMSSLTCIISIWGLQVKPG